MKCIRLLTLILFTFQTSFVLAEQVFNSGSKQISLVELYTSEGCSSCPPADRWFSRLKDTDKLWKSYVPVAFHVDYWNQLGWKDRFSHSTYSKRQRHYKRKGNINSVYTPGFVVAGKEWRGWFRGKKLPDQQEIEAGSLQLTLSDNDFQAQFQSEISDLRLRLNVATLAMSQTTPVRQGENSGKRLQHDFVVIELDSFETKSGKWQGHLSSLDNDEIHAIAAWVSLANDPTPIQAVGGYLKSE